MRITGPLLDRLADNLRETLSPTSLRDLAALSAALAADGLWPDLDYTTTACAGSARFPAFDHLRRAVSLAAAADRDSALAQAALSALRGWLRIDPHTDHHWFENLGAPQLLGFLAVFHHHALRDTERTAIAATLARGWDDAVPPVPRFGPSPATGQNLLWMAGNRAVAALLLGDQPLLRHTLALIAAELLPALGEGIQPDASFHQHGPLLYTGGYGASLSRDALRWICVLHESPFALPAPSVASVLRHVLDGQQWMSRGRSWHWPAVGRELARPGHDASPLAPALAAYARLAAPRSAEAAAFASRIQNSNTPFAVPVGNRLFWRSDAMAHARPGFSFLIRASSARTRGHESGNGEAEPCALLGDGAVSLLVSGDEYRDLFPLWRWRHVPGVSARHPSPDEPLPVHQWGVGAEGGSDFSGGVSDGRVGAFAYHQAAHGVSARRAWFCLDDALIALGADLRSADSAPLRTTLDQRHSDGPVTRLPGGGLHHAGVCWLPLQGPAPTHDVEHRTGTWEPINRNLANLQAEADVFTAWLEHGPSPSPFAYACLPGLLPADVPGWLVRAPRILRNDAVIQALASGDALLVQAVFHSSAKLILPDGRTLAADGPCLVQLDLAARILAVGNPLGVARRVLVTLDACSFPVEFAPGGEAGKSVLIAC